MPEVRSRFVEVCVFRFRSDAPEFLLLRRSRDEKVYPGLWQFVTGKVRPGEHAVDAARREMEEETGLVPIRFWTVPHCSTFYDPGADAVEVVPFFAAQVDEGSAPRLSREHEECLWLPPPAARDRLVWPGQRGGLEAILGSIAGGGEAGLRSRLI